LTRPSPIDTSSPSTVFSEIHSLVAALIVVLLARSWLPVIDSNTLVL
jgi:hypothetical protein